MNAFQTRSACPVCDSANIAAIFARPYEEPHLRAALTSFYAEVGGLDYPALLGADYSVARCNACGLVFQVSVPNDTLLGRLYEEWIDPQKAFERFHQSPPPHRQAELAWEVKVAASLMAPSTPPLALDYGCGWGEWSAATQRHGFAPWGTELSITRRRHAEEAGVRVVSDDLLPNASFGLINLDQVLEHVPQPRETLALLAAKLHPGGVLRIGVPNGFGVTRALKRFDRELTKPRLGRLNPVAPLEHLNCFTTRPLVRLAAACGLQRVVPAWAVLLRGLVWPCGARAKTKTILRPFYLRSRFTTQLYFKRATAAPGT